MKERLMKCIEENQNIVIARHKNPDLDAYGSQFGLYYALKERYPNKQISVIGDTNTLNQFGALLKASDVSMNESLVILLDTVAKQMLLPEFYENSKVLFLIDHHQNEPDIKHDYWWHDTSASSTSEIIATFLWESGFDISSDSAKALYLGIVGDTGRFMFASTTAKTFRVVSWLMERNFNAAQLLNNMYTESFETKKMKADFFSSIQLTKNHVGYRKNDLDFQEKHHLDSNYCSRGLVNQMSGITEIPIWANFTLDAASKGIWCELRSRDIPVLEVAKKHGGGGHLNACGCTVGSWDETNQILAELDQLLEEKNG